jgi:steroid 5-alpha reductase family enzyme
MTMSDLALLLLGNFAVLLLALAALWAVSVRLKDASIIDIAWGPACALGPLLTYWRADGASPRDLVLTALVSLWATRLALHLARRNLGHGEDYRYAKMREKQGSDAAFARWSLVRVYGLQGVIAWFVSWPAQLGQLGPDKPLGAIALVGAAVFAIGLAFEAIGDWQLNRFKADPANKGKLMTTGLWAWTRHPNYFGDAAVWTGLTIIALESPYGWATILSPAVMAFFLVNVSGKAMLERAMEKKYPEYSGYKQSTSGFFPLPPKG